MELPDPRLDGNFPKEEMRILTYLAKECLQLDPDDRPTISEVVQILCAIAPERSTRRNIHVNLFEVILSCHLKSYFDYSWSVLDFRLFFKFEQTNV